MVRRTRILLPGPWFLLGSCLRGRMSLWGRMLLRCGMLLRCRSRLRRRVYLLLWCRPLLWGRPFLGRRAFRGWVLYRRCGSLLLDLPFWLAGAWLRYLVLLLHRMFLLGRVFLLRWAFLLSGRSGWSRQLTRLDGRRHGLLPFHRQRLAHDHVLRPPVVFGDELSSIGAGFDPVLLLDP